ncbi:MAG TPA: MarR family winged helix-turn-helix transcriptional regulator, partial [Polyangiaceae bacterium]|nr:MarR family winged helix-turn-helix transcriptional regulator [Polyangiaceae bacterium]
VARGITRIGRDEICCGTLTLQQFQTLSAIDRAGRITTSALAAALSIDLSTASRNLTLLERQELVARHRDPGDARVVFLKLTGKGARALVNLRCDERLVYAGVLARIPAERRAAVIEALETLAGALGESDIEAPAKKEPCCPDSAPESACPPKRARRRA